VDLQSPWAKSFEIDPATRFHILCPRLLWPAVLNSRFERKTAALLMESKERLER
jgi:hypothetical protein